MLYLFILFFFFIYAICETFKYSKWKTYKLNFSENGRLYRQSVVIIKLISIIITYILIIVNRFIRDGIVEKSSGLKGFVMISVIFIPLIGLSIYDVIKYKEHNSKILSKITSKKEMYEE